MTNKTRVSHGSQRQILDQARDRLRDKDIDGYWALLARHDGYAGLAREAAANRGDLGRTANARLERFAREHRGRPLDEAEREAIRNEVAAADLARRERNLEDRGDHRISGQDSVDYHAAVFEARDIPKEAYFPAELQPTLGGLWGIRAGILLPDAANIDLEKAFADSPFDKSSEWMTKDLRPIIDAPFRQEVIENAQTLPPQGLMEMEGFHGSDPTSESQQKPKQKSAQPASSFAAQFAALPPSPQRWLDFTLAKAPADLSERDLHALQAHDAYLRPYHPRRDEAFRLVSDTYRHLYGDTPQQMDVTGRPLRDPPQHRLPENSAISAAERQRSADLSALGAQLDRWQDAFGGDADARRRVTNGLQRGLNALLWPGMTAPGPADAAKRRYRGGPVLVDGILGPVTADALDQAQAEFGLAPLQDEIARFVAPAIAKDGMKEWPERPRAALAVPQPMA